MHLPPKSRLFASLATATTATLLLAACGGTGAASSGEAKDFSLTINDDNHIVQQELTTLSTGACKSQNQALPLKIQTLPIGDVDQKVQLLAGQDALPVQFAAGSTPQLTKTLDKGGQVQDLEKSLKDLGVWDDIQPAAAKTVENLYGKFNVMPYQFNIEGIWFNKKLFAQHGITVPQTYDQLVAAAAKLKGAGVVPFSASGKAGWPITRLVSGYLYRELGPDALQAVADGKAKLTDPAYVKAAQAVADLGKAGDFGAGVESIDYDTSVQQFLTGKAAMFYMGSWELGDFNDATKDLIGAANIGFMPFPTVAGGKGSADQIPANVGLPVAVSAKSYNTKVGDWLSCVAKNYGASSLKNQGTISGFKANGDTGTLPPLTQMVQNTIDKTTTSTLWFEALFNTKATETSQTNAASLVTGTLSAQDFMQKVQSDLANG
ncbi:ABC transporter substrate-binding protein [Streptacidiphilus carbonis]|uniref:ABC transporter substrate-binding protein n=1 Tax=Streptacidiphilus carbonis TaxID=105422 RepID=UPI0005A8092F|nr:extracellular solute-binding protein [Streptacidiphilus carbonis]